MDENFRGESIAVSAWMRKVQSHIEFKDTTSKCSKSFTFVTMLTVSVSPLITVDVFRKNLSQKVMKNQSKQSTILINMMPPMATQTFQALLTFYWANVCWFLKSISFVAKCIKACQPAIQEMQWGKLGIRLKA